MPEREYLQELEKLSRRGATEARLRTCRILRAWIAASLTHRQLEDSQEVAALQWLLNRAFTEARAVALGKQSTGPDDIHAKQVAAVGELCLFTDEMFWENFKKSDALAKFKADTKRIEHTREYVKLRAGAWVGRGEKTVERGAWPRDKDGGLESGWLELTRQWLERYLKHDDVQSELNVYLDTLQADEPSLSTATVHTVAAPPTRPFPRALGFRLSGWYWAEVASSVIVKAWNEIRIVERHTIVATEEGLDRFGYFVTLPPGWEKAVQLVRVLLADPNSKAAPHELAYWTRGAEVDDEVFEASGQGGTVPSSDRLEELSSNCYYFERILHRDLRRGERYDMTITYELRGPAAAHYVFVPPGRCSKLIIDIEFSPTVSPPGIYRIEGLPPLFIRDCLTSVVSRPANQSFVFGEKEEERLDDYCWAVPTEPYKLQLGFEQPLPGVGYGFFWQPGGSRGALGAV